MLQKGRALENSAKARMSGMVAFLGRWSGWPHSHINKDLKGVKEQSMQMSWGKVPGGGNSESKASRILASSTLVNLLSGGNQAACLALSYVTRFHGRVSCHKAPHGHILPQLVFPHTGLQIPGRHVPCLWPGPGVSKPGVVSGHPSPSLSSWPTLRSW